MAKLRKLTEEQFADIVQRYRAGESVASLARDYSVQPTGLRRTLNHRLKPELNGLRHSRPQTVVIPQNPTELAYIAGIIDGEGCITHRGDRLWQVCVYNTDKPLIDWLASFGGHAYVRHFKPDYKSFVSRLTQYGWHLQRNRDVLAFLVAVVPYLRIKKEKALLVISEIELRLKLEG